MIPPSGNSESRAALDHKFLGTLSHDVDGIDIAAGVQRQAVHPIEIARPFFAVCAFGNGDELKQFAGRIEFHEQLIVRSKEFMDNATPSGNSIATLSLLRLALLTGNEDYRRRATAVLRLMADQIRRYPSAFGFALSALDFYLDSPLEVVVVGSSDPRLDELLRTVWQTYLPNRVIALCRKDHDQAAAVVPLFTGRNTLASQPTAFVCQANTCQQPVTTAADLLGQLLPKNPRGASFA